MVSVLKHDVKCRANAIKKRNVEKKTEGKYGGKNDIHTQRMNIKKMWKKIHLLYKSFHRHSPS